MGWRNELRSDMNHGRTGIIKPCYRQPLEQEGVLFTVPLTPPPFPSAGTLGWLCGRFWGLGSQSDGYQHALLAH
jgi:hypothetical protein